MRQHWKSSTRSSLLFVFSSASHLPQINVCKGSLRIRALRMTCLNAGWRFRSGFGGSPHGSDIGPCGDISDRIQPPDMILYLSPDFGIANSSSGSTFKSNMHTQYF